jgi:hypothetical protein
VLTLQKEGKERILGQKHLPAKISFAFPLLPYDHLLGLCREEEKKGRYRSVTLPSLYRHITVTETLQHHYSMLFC